MSNIIKPHLWEEVDKDRESVAERFSWLFFYDEGSMTNTWMGRRIQKSPLELHIYAEIAYEVKPRVVIETGSFYGGSAMWWSDILSLVHEDDNYTIISVDPNRQDKDFQYKNVLFIEGSSIDPGIIRRIYGTIHNYSPVLVNLDSLHDMDHVYNEMIAYDEFVTPGSYMIVEDGVINGHPTHPEYGPGPYEACELFLSEHPEYEADRSRERLFVTSNPMGYLKKNE